MKLALATVLAAFFAWPVDAAPHCASYAAVTDILTSKYSETRRIGGLSKFGDLFEFWASDKTGSWSVVKKRPDGLSCIVDEGQMYREIPTTPEGEEM